MTPDEKPSSRLRFDGTINWPFVVTLLLIGGGAVGFGNKLVGQIDTVNLALIEQKNAADKQVTEVKNLTDSVNNIRLDLAKQDGVRNVVTDHEARIRALENRGPNE
jgi:hypothetical protein